MNLSTRPILSTTLNLLKSHRACTDGYRTLLKYVGSDYDPNAPIDLLTVLTSNGLDDCFWTLRATTNPALAERLSSLAACDFAERVVHNYPEEETVLRDCIQTARDYADGKATDEQLQKADSAARSAAWSAADSAARSAAEGAAEGAAWSAARSAARSAAWSAADSAAWSAARSAAEGAAWRAAWSAADSAAWRAAWRAADSAAWNAAWNAPESAEWSAEKDAQTEILRKYLTEGGYK